jgi:hypothetical protein
MLKWGNVRFSTSVDDKVLVPAFFLGRKIAKRQHCPNFLAKIPFFPYNQFARLRPFLMSELPQVCLLATLLILQKKSIAS